MSLVKVNAIIHPTGSANNITLDNAGNITFANTIAVSGSSVYPLVRTASQATTSGTSIDFTSIPSWAKRITIMFNSVGTNGSSYFLVRVGTSSTPTTTGYSSSSQQTGGSSDFQSSTAGFILTLITNVMVKSGTVTLFNSTGNTWLATHNLYGLYSGSTHYQATGAGIVTLSGALDMVRITTVNGTDAFSTGSISIMYE